MSRAEAVTMAEVSLAGMMGLASSPITRQEVLMAELSHSAPSA